MEKSSLADNSMEKIAQQLSGTIFELQDITGELRDFSSTIDLDPASLEITDQRLDLVSKLKRKYGGTLASLFDEYEKMQQKLAQTTDIENQIKKFEQESIEHLLKIGEIADKLSIKRKSAALNLSRLAKKQLEALEMGRANFEVDFEDQRVASSEEIATGDGQKIWQDGKDKVSFLLSSNPGEALKPLVKIASGGELSRIVLALKAVLSKNQSLETLIFDEVDAGIGGAVSEKVGLKLKQLSHKHQVICITHLAQIAKYAENQFRISKDVNNGRTFTTIVPLAETKQRVEEIARMIGGASITDTTLNHARELLEQAST